MSPKSDREQLGTRQTKPFPRNDVCIELLFCGHESQKWGNIRTLTEADLCLALGWCFTRTRVWFVKRQKIYSNRINFGHLKEITTSREVSIWLCCFVLFFLLFLVVRIYLFMIFWLIIN